MLADCEKREFGLRYAAPYALGFIWVCARLKACLRGSPTAHGVCRLQIEISMGRRLATLAYRPVTDKHYTRLAMLESLDNISHKVDDALCRHIMCVRRDPTHSNV